MTIRKFSILYPIFIFILNIYASPLSTESTSLQIDSLIAKSRELHLSDSKEWKTLLHIDNKTSEIISSYFFLTPLPSKNLAQDELEATIRAFYQSLDEVVIPQKIKQQRVEQIKEFEKNNIKLPVRSIKTQDYHALCRFPARFAFLSKHLTFENLPVFKCEEFEEMKSYISPTKASIIFPTAHINSPASMFGHTFLLLDSSFQSRLLAFAINYQADANPDEENPIGFAIKGLFGFYTGSYSILPYYDKIKEYSNTESRDMWEYELNLTKQEIEQLYNHIWELSDAFSWYYFFNKNCSYNILWLLEVARPSLALRQKFIYQVNPPETLFVLKEANLITNISYRPSKRAKLLSYEKVMNYAQVSMAKGLALGTLKPQDVINKHNITHMDKQYILESAIEFSEYNFLKRKLEKEQYTQIVHELASVRSTLGANTPPPSSIPTNPLEGNQSLRITPLILSNTNGIHPALDFRITFHDITDNDNGYLKGAQIELMRVLGYYDANNKNAKLHELNIISVASIAPISKFFKPFSYRLASGFNRSFYDDNLHYFLSFGGGLSYQFGDIAYVYYLFEPTFLSTAYKADFTLSSAMGIVIQNNKRLKTTLEYNLKAYDIAHFSHYIDGTFSINIKHNIAAFARIQILNNDIHTLTNPTSMLGMRLYF